MGEKQHFPAPHPDEYFGEDLETAHKNFKKQQTDIKGMESGFDIDQFNHYVALAEQYRGSKLEGPMNANLNLILRFAGIEIPDLEDATDGKETVDLDLVYRPDSFATLQLKPTETLSRDEYNLLSDFEKSKFHLQQHGTHIVVYFTQFCLIII